jgi:hypothetical protein
VELDALDSAVPKPNHGEPFQFTPSSVTVTLGQAPQVSNAVPRGDRLHANDLTEDLEPLLVHLDKLTPGSAAPNNLRQSS